ncbi:MAG: hypothetical protein ACOCRO_06800 [Halanaerobiales bacterium]
MKKSDIKEFFKEPRIIILVIFLILSIIAIKPFPQSGVAIRHVESNSSAYHAGLRSPTSPYPMEWERITEMNGHDINSISDFRQVSSEFGINQTVNLRTSERFYSVRMKNESLGVEVSEVSDSNLKFGLDINGGTRAILNPETSLDDESMENLISILGARLDVYGIADVDIRSANDLDGNQFIVVEIAGATRQEVMDLLGSQGKFEAKVGNQTVFVGGNDISHVGRSAEEARITCSRESGDHVCQFQFALTISSESSERFADATKGLDVSVNDSNYLEKPIIFYLDDNVYSTLQISTDLKGSETRDVSISGSEVGTSENEARDATRNEMRRLQTVLSVGSLPVDLSISRIDEVSPVFGAEFLSNAVLVGLFALLSVALVLFIRYRNPLISLGIFFTMFSEIILLLGFAAFTGWNLDLIAIAGIVIAVGTGVDDQIVITDEVMRDGKKKARRSLKEKIKRAFFIIFGTYTTTVVAMLPLLWAGVGLLRGFAFTTIVGVTVGVFLTRPAYAKYIEKIA